MNQQRRLSDKIIAAHKQACENGNREVAELLHQALEIELSAIGGNKKEFRDSMDYLEQAFQSHEKMLEET